MFGMTYGWTIDYINELTWPMISKLFRRIKENPPVDIVVAAMLKTQNQKPSMDQLGGFGVPMRKGKVLRRK